MHPEIQDITHIIQAYKHVLIISGTSTSAIYIPKRKTWMQKNNIPAKNIKNAR